MSSNLDGKMLLSLVIPTFNRSSYLNNQIAWAVESIGNNWLDVELLICDNASTDATVEVCASWKEKLENKIKIIVNSYNIGLVKNCLSGISNANGEFIWLIGDDDPIDKEAVSKVLNVIRDFSNLSMIHLNHKCISGIDGSVIIPKFYTLDKDINALDDSPEQLSRILQNQHTGGFMFITANILNRNKALEFIEKNPPEDKNLLAYPMFLNVGLANNGPFYLMAHSLVDCVYHQSSWSSKYEEVTYEEVPKTLYKLKEKGVSIKALKNCMNHQYKDFPSLRDVIYILRKKPDASKSFDTISWTRRWLLKIALQWKLEFL